MIGSLKELWKSHCSNDKPTCFFFPGNYIELIIRYLHPCHCISASIYDNMTQCASTHHVQYSAWKNVCASVNTCAHYYIMYSVCTVIPGFPRTCQYLITCLNVCFDCLVIMSLFLKSIWDHLSSCSSEEVAAHLQGFRPSHPLLTSGLPVAARK